MAPEVGWPALRMVNGLILSRQLLRGVPDNLSACFEEPVAILRNRMHCHLILRYVRDSTLEERGTRLAHLGPAM